MVRVFELSSDTRTPGLADERAQRLGMSYIDVIIAILIHLPVAKVDNLTDALGDGRQYRMSESSFGKLRKGPTRVYIRIAIMTSI
jgi:hypothetical protein